MGGNDYGIASASVLSYYIDLKAKKCGVKSNSSPIRNFANDKVTDAVVELCEEFEKKYEASFGDMCKECSRHELNQEGYWNILCELLDNDLNWGRIIAIFAFAGALSVDRMRRNCPGDVEKIEDWTCKFMNRHVDKWIQKNNGWKGLLEFYNKPDEKKNGGWGSMFAYAFGAACLRVLLPNQC